MENGKPNKYNLLDEEWIPVLYCDGERCRVGIKTALSEAHLIRQIATSNPMDRVAILRFLLALLYWCKGNPLQECSAVSGGQFPADWFSKLDGYRECFNLLGEGKRFFQFKETEDNKEPEKSSVNYLIHEVPTGTNWNHFRHAIDKIDGLCPACCAIGLIRLPAFATSGGRKKGPGINKKPPVYAIPLGTTLAETLRLSAQSVIATDLGTPAWENPQLELPQAGEVPLLTGLTWLPRQVWLDKPQAPEGLCISCGRKGPLIKECIFVGRGGMKKKNYVWNDPHVIADVPTRNALDSLDKATRQWSEIICTLLEKQKYEQSQKWLIVGFATVQNDKYLEATGYEILLPELTDDQRQNQIGIIKIEQKIKKKALTNLKKTRPASSPRKLDDLNSMFNSVYHHAETSIAARAVLGELIGRTSSLWNQAVSEAYTPMMEAVARSLYPGFTVTELEYRHKVRQLSEELITGR